MKILINILYKINSIDTVKNTVISNIVQFVIYNSIKKGDHINEAKEEPINDLIFNSSYSLNATDGVSLWQTLIKDLSLDKITVHLFENFSDAIEKEDYMMAAVMKREILSRWKLSLSENDILKRGSEYISSLKIGISHSEIFRNLLDTVDDIEQNWKKHGLKSVNYILDNLLQILNDFKMHDFEEVKDEAFDFLLESDYEHPIIIIDYSITYFNILKN